jgi:glutathionyl-hydroquinone reductase
MGVGVLIDGKWTDDDETYRKGGAFVRATTAFRALVTADGSSAFPAEARALSFVRRAPLPLVPSHHDLPRAEGA